MVERVANMKVIGRRRVQSQALLVTLMGRSRSLLNHVACKTESSSESCVAIEKR